ncbi:MAG: NAD(P)H-hydrate dehydratase [Planctomycetota bacterium]
MPDASGDWIELSEGPPALPVRATDGHKGTFGRVAVVGGCAPGDGGFRPLMIGAPALAGLGALRAGAGLVRLVSPGPVLDGALGLCPGATGIALATDESGDLTHDAGEALLEAMRASDVGVVGCGLGPGAGVEHALRTLHADRERTLVLDADGLNHLCDAGAWLGCADSPSDALRVLTPHPGEFARLADALGIKGDATDDAERPRLATDLARATGAVVVLKGRGTVVSDGERCWVCQRGHPCLATGGTGDVLAGVMGALLADRSHAGDAFDRVRSAVLAHALAGEWWARRRGASGGMLATELTEHIPEAIESLRG